MRFSAVFLAIFKSGLDQPLIRSQSEGSQAAIRIGSGLGQAYVLWVSILASLTER
jgi:hypothetical protein